MSVLRSDVITPGDFGTIKDPVSQTVDNSVEVGLG